MPSLLRLEQFFAFFIIKHLKRKQKHQHGNCSFFVTVISKENGNSFKQALNFGYQVSSIPRQKDLEFFNRKTQKWLQI